MSTFDGTTHESAWPPPAAPMSDEPQAAPVDPFDALDMLREQVEAREEDSERVTHVTVPRLGWRLVCGIDFEFRSYKEWQKAALPKSQRNGRKLNILDLDQAILGQLVLLNTCEGMEWQTAAGEWTPLLDAQDRPVLPGSSALLSKFNVVDPRSLIRKLFGGDAATIVAGQKVISAAGYAEGDDDESDPLG